MIIRGHRVPWALSLHPGSLYEIIPDLVLADADEQEKEDINININKDFQTPLALRLCHQTRADKALHHFANYRFVLPRKRFLAWLLQVTPWHKQSIRGCSFPQIP